MLSERRSNEKPRESGTALLRGRHMHNSRIADARDTALHLCRKRQYGHDRNAPLNSLPNDSSIAADRCLLISLATLALTRTVIGAVTHQQVDSTSTFSNGFAWHRKLTSVTTVQLPRRAAFGDQCMATTLVFAIDRHAWANSDQRCRHRKHRHQQPHHGWSSDSSEMPCSHCQLLLALIE